MASRSGRGPSPRRVACGMLGPLESGHELAGCEFCRAAGRRIEEPRLSPRRVRNLRESMVIGGLHSRRFKTTVRKLLAVTPRLYGHPTIKVCPSFQGLRRFEIVSGGVEATCFELMMRPRRRV